MIQPLLEGFRYLADFLSIVEEQELIGRMEAQTFEEVTMRGAVAKRKTRHFGWVYGYESWEITRGQPIPDWILPLRARIADLIQEPPEKIEEVLLSQYPAGAGIGWHRDAPMFGSKVVGVSLAGTCRFRFQRRRGEARDVLEYQLEPRSAYLMSGQARTLWQHSIPPTKAFRYSITFRTIKNYRSTEK
ncbi:MAG TPA: alpha-ketoglutarate-dependent dioxygenase AlkB [Nitrospira sp.]|nr:alpha-ketoglutarate-dependent dioxygenase AlkB [Nitrospira sp.]